jgi:arylsulfatase A-like enzyme
MTAVWFGLIGGSVQAILAATERYGLRHYTHLSKDVVWAAPISAALVLLPAGVFLHLLLGRREHLEGQTATAISAAISSLGVLYYWQGVHPLARFVLAAGIGIGIGRFVVVRRDTFVRVVRRTTLPLLGLVIALSVILNAAYAIRERYTIAGLPAAPPRAPNVLLLVLDAVRARDLSLYGYERETTPALSRWAARGVVFERATSAAPWTLPSHSSMFTGRAPHELSADWRTPLDDRYPTLAEVLERRGYLTGGFAGNLAYASSESGLDRGFAHYEGYLLTPGNILASGRVFSQVANSKTLRDALDWHDLIERKPADGIRERLVAWLDAHPGRPWFVFANFYDAHDPYLPPAPYDTAFTGRKIPSSERNFALANPEPLTPAQAKTERDAYDQALRWLDSQVGMLLDTLDQRGVLANTIVIVTADHGEEFGEHGLISHGSSLYLQSLRVPLLMIHGGQIPAALRVGSIVSLRDLPATILDLAGAPAALPGRSLRAAWTPDSAGLPASLMAEVRYAPRIPAWMPVARGDMVTLVTNHRQLIRDGEGRFELLDLDRDPAGSVPAADEPDSIARLSALLPRFQR